MADNLSLTATVREGVGKGAAREARRNDLVPGIVYGGSEDPLNINVKFNELLKKLNAGKFMSTLINLSDRLNADRRENYEDQPNYEYKSLLVVIDEYSSRGKQWSKINHQKLGKFGIYNLWRIQKSDLNKYSKFLVKSGYKSDWLNRKVDKF